MGRRSQPACPPQESPPPRSLPAWSAVSSQTANSGNAKTIEVDASSVATHHVGRTVKGEQHPTRASRAVMARCRMLSGDEPRLNGDKPRLGPAVMTVKRRLAACLRGAPFTTSMPTAGITAKPVPPSHNSLGSYRLAKLRFHGLLAPAERWDISAHEVSDCGAFRPKMVTLRTRDRCSICPLFLLGCGLAVL